jgi:hypothetical protein
MKRVEGSISQSLRFVGTDFVTFGLVINPGGFMQRINCSPFVTMGQDLALLVDRLKTSTEYTFDQLARDGVAATASLAKWAVDTVFPVPLLSKHEATNLATKFIGLSAAEFLEEHRTEAIPDKDDLIFQIMRFIDLLAYDLETCDSYIITQKRAYDMKALIFNAQKILPASVIPELSTECIKDIQEAGRCLAFDLPTACGFHMFRALELVMLMYFPVLKITAPSERKKGLGTYINLLEGKDENGKDKQDAPKVDTEITGTLRRLKKHRNPVIHPELTLEEEEAESLFINVNDAIAQMVKDIKRLKDAQLPQEGTEP